MDGCDNRAGTHTRGSSEGSQSGNEVWEGQFLETDSHGIGSGCGQRKTWKALESYGQSRIKRNLENER